MIGKLESGGGIHGPSFYDVISPANLLQAWEEFKRGKRSKIDVAKFGLNLEDNLFDLHQRLTNGSWKPDPYTVFSVYDPKLRKIHKATVKDRVLYQAVYRKLYPLFDPGFIFQSYSSREFKGTHRGMKSLEKSIRKITSNSTIRGYVLKCDVRKFFDSIDHTVLFRLISRKINDSNLLILIGKIIASFKLSPGKGLPLGNVTSQLFANIYMNELDQYVKRKLKIKHYARYCDDFGIVSDSLEKIVCYVKNIKQFCEAELLLHIHPKKIIIRKIHNGIDFLGYVLLPHRRTLRTRTKIRMFKKLNKLKESVDSGKIEKEFLEQSVQSYLGVISHCKNEKIVEQIERIFWD